MKHQFNRRAFHRAVWTSISRLIGVALGAGAGSLIYQLIGGGFQGWGVALGLLVISFLLIIFAEYEKEINL
jgi:uncharacterized membrane protein YgaE (UPF0421/DUF939 family)